MKKMSTICLSLLLASSIGATALAALPQYPNYTNVQQGQVYGQCSRHVHCWRYLRHTNC